MYFEKADVSKVACRDVVSLARKFYVAAREESSLQTSQPTQAPFYFITQFIFFFSVQICFHSTEESKF